MERCAYPDIPKHCLRRFGGALIIGASGAAPAGSAMAEPPKTIEPGKLTIGINGDMPMTSVKDGKLIGTDGELLAQIAGQSRPRGQAGADGMVGADPGHEAGQGRHHARLHGLDQGAHQDHDPDRSDLLLRHLPAAEEGHELLRPSRT